MLCPLKSNPYLSTVAVAVAVIAALYIAAGNTTLFCSVCIVQGMCMTPWCCPSPGLIVTHSHSHSHSHSQTPLKEEEKAITSCPRL